MIFIVVLIVPPRITLPPSVVRAIPGYRLSCSATGTSPIYTALMKNSSTLTNTTYTATITLYEEGNYTCAATNKYGTDVRDFHVIFKGKNFLS